MKQLVQPFLDTTDATTLLSQTADVKLIVVCNSLDEATTYSIFHPNNGADTPAKANALFYQTALAANATEIIELPITLSHDAQVLSAQAGTANALTITIYGED